MNRFFSGGILASMCFSLCVSCSSRELSPNNSLQKEIKNVTVVKSDEYQETSYKVDLDGCSLSWTIYHTELNNGIINNDHKCDIPLSEQIPYFADILKKILEENPGTVFHTFFYGRLTPDFHKNDLELSERLVMAAHNSKAWDAGKGRPIDPYANEVVREMANSATIYPELKELFQSFNLSVEISAVEKVLVRRAKELPYFDKLKSSGIEPSEKLPYDCMTWFSIKQEG